MRVLLSFLLLGYLLTGCKKQSDIEKEPDTIVYFTSRGGSLYALDALTGTQRWKCLLDSVYNVGGYIPNLNISSPIFEKGILYVGHSNGSLYAVDAKTGTKKWEYKAEASIHSSPTVANGIVYVGSNDKNLYAIDGITGKKRWAYTTGDWVYSSPAVVNGVVYVGSLDNRLYALDALSGVKKWEFDTGSAIYSSPTVENGQVYISSTLDVDAILTGITGKVFSINAASGVKRWEYVRERYAKSRLVSPIIYNGVLYTAGDIMVQAVDATNGTKKWELDLRNDFSSSPVIVDSTLYIGRNDGQSMVAININTGTRRWRTFTNPYDTVCSPVVANGLVYFGGPEDFYALDAVRGHLKWQFKAGSYVCSNALVVKNGEVYGAYSTDSGTRN
ncbi:outer membrane protein assembly factor BamB [Larkinella arboricola]|uniref:Outer membrane protein assembly factor BamB n=1 Tax=Larkinella arboricola TaxID=643671 RepID=A0A327WY06_LARAB|nr:PQQ-binding-like beta-propeller repeat protein [Larkinella arboricola]RAJ97400.1 outer membrane protein assembly factor BamB [Larkinella arboricola]